MALPIPTTTPDVRPPLRVRLPFVSTPFSTNLWYYALLWPVWWALGIDQILLPFFIFFEFFRFLITSEWRLQLNATSLFALLLAVWWVVPLIWVDRQFLDIFLKEAATAWAQAFILILIWNRVQTQRDWRRLVGALTIIAFYMVSSSAIYLVGLWRGELLSAVGRILPPSLVQSSAFFSSIAYRHFGEFFTVDVGFFTQRLIAFTLSFSSLSMVCLLLIPLMVWRFQTERGVMRLFCAGLAGGLLIALVFTESRIAYAALLAGFVLYLILRLHLLRARNRPLTLALGLLLVALALILGFVALGLITESLHTAFIDLRPGSWLARYRIYEYTLQLLPEHFIAGWGVPVRIPGMANEYSAGTHSSYLGMLFQHGIIGLIFYLGMWLSVWLIVWRGLRQRRGGRAAVLFWMATAMAFFAFNIREVADAWWWDQSLLFVIWLLWGLTLTAPRIFQDTPTHG